MAITQKEANYLALYMAATMVEIASLDMLFGDDYDIMAEEKLGKAQQTAVRRIRAMLPKNWSPRDDKNAPFFRSEQSHP
jgi:hypothetical protein